MTLAGLLLLWLQPRQQCPRIRANPHPVKGAWHCARTVRVIWRQSRTTNVSAISVICYLPYVSAISVSCMSSLKVVVGMVSNNCFGLFPFVNWILVFSTFKFLEDPEHHFSSMITIIAI
jgi:hypothetical protein